MLTHYGTSNIIVMGLTATILLALALFFQTNSHLILGIIFYILSFVLFAFTFWFFRDPERKVPDIAKNNAEYIISPADGHIVEIVEEFEKHYLQQNSKRISIFLSPFDVHVNRLPATGTIEYFKYIPGKYIIANHPKASELNEQSHIGLRTEFGTIFFKQIVGIVARRLVCELKEKDEVNVGDRFGMMKFGSRMDIALPIDAEILINIGDKVVAGETLVAKLKTPHI